MAVVLSSAEENSYFSSSPLRRSHSQPKFGTKRSGFQTSSSASRISELYNQPRETFGESIASSSPPSSIAIHPESSDMSCVSTPSSNFSVASDCSEVDHLESVAAAHAISRHYGGGYFDHVEDSGSPSPHNGNTSSNENENETSTTASRPDSPELIDRATDDIAIRVQPSRHVDYLSHNWREEDIWSSWKLIVSRRGDYANASRLENASWRTWMKSKNKLSTVSPETLNWLKDCDVTWLYGPLQTGRPSSMNPINTGSNSGRLSKSSSFAKKPILKKRSMSELMLQRSLSTSSLVKQAAAAVQAQQKEEGGKRGRRPAFGRAITDYVAFPFSSRGVSHDNTSLFPSAVSSGFVSPSGERRHIHFNEQVEQCIAVDVKGEDDEEDVDPYAYNNSDSDDGAIMMKRTNRLKKRRPTIRKSKSHGHSAESKTIAMLPSTTLKYREDTPESTESAMKHSTTMFRSPLGSPSSSQETLRPKNKSGKLFISSDDSDDSEEEEKENPPSSIPASETAGGGGGGFGLKRSSSSSGLANQTTGMRRTESGMFMPFEEGEPSAANEGLLGRVIDTKGAARDKNTPRIRLGSGGSSSSLAKLGVR